MKKGESVVITGMGVVSPLGTNMDALWDNLLLGKTAVQHFNDLESAGYRNTRACKILNFEAPALSRGLEMALYTTRRAISQAGISLPENTGVFLGSTLGESMAYEMAAEGDNINLSEYNTYSLARAIATEFCLTGTVNALSTACTAGNYAVGAAMNAIRSGEVPVAIAGGVEPFSRMAMVGFSRSRAMAPETCKPFDAERNGMILGEGAAFFILEKLEDAELRGATPLATVYSLGLSCDAYHPTAPHPDGRGLATAIQHAFKLAGLDSQKADWVNIHGSGTVLSDAAEARALKTVFNYQMPVLSGSKGAIGHALGAASALELAICVRGIVSNIIPPTPGHDIPDEKIGLNCTTAPLDKKLNIVVNSSSAFGGLNAALLIGACA